MLQRLLDDGVLADVSAKGEELTARLLSSPLGSSPLVGDIRGRGLFVGIEFVADRACKTPFPRALQVSQRVQAEAFALGLTVYPGTGSVDGILGDHLLLAPPYIIGSAEMELLAGLLATAVARVATQLGAL